MAKLNLGGISRALRHRDFRLYVLGGGPSMVGSWIQKLAAGWLIWELTQSATWLGALALAEFLPLILLSPIAGALADRFDRMTIFRLTQLLNAAQAGLLCTLTATGLITPELLIGLTLWLGLNTAFAQPVRQPLIAALVPAEDIPPAIALNASLWHASGFVGPAIAGLIMVTWGVAPAFGVNAASFIMSLYVLYRIRVPLRRRERRSIRDVPREIAEGYRYAIRHPGIGRLLLMLLVVSAFVRPIRELLPGVSESVFAMGKVGLSWLAACMGLGAMAGGLYIASRGRTQGATRIAVFSMLLAASTLALFVGTGFFPVALVAIAGLGLALTVNGLCTQTLVLSATDEALHGRVISIYGLVFMGAPALGAIVMGGLADLLGFTWPALAGAFVCLAAWGWARGHAATITGATEGRQGQIVSS